MSTTFTDTDGRCWTVITERAVVGFLWRIYLHRLPLDQATAGALELMQPGGVAHGWTDDDHDDERVRALLLAFMGMKGAVPC